MLARTIGSHVARRKIMVGLLKAFVGVGVTYSRHEEAEAEGQHDEIQHEVLLVALVLVRDPLRLPGRI